MSDLDETVVYQALVRIRNAQVRIARVADVMAAYGPVAPWVRDGQIGVLGMSVEADDRLAAGEIRLRQDVAA